MTFDTARQAILKEAQRVKRSRRVQELEIDLMGGEPMVNFKLVKEIVEWLESTDIGVPWIVSMTTNGTLFTDERKRWFIDHKDSICCGISWDGTDQMQTQNRGKRSDKADLGFFIQTWPDQSVHMTISKESLPFFHSGAISLQRKGIEVEAALAEGPLWNMQDVALYERELTALAEEYLADDSLQPINLLMRPVDVVNPLRDRRKMRMFCGSGSYMTTYDVDGQKFGCHMFSPIVLGPRSIPIQRLDIKDPKSVCDETCVKCALKHFCPTCAGFNFRYRGQIGIRDKTKCHMHLVEARVSAMFQLKLIAAQRKSLSIDSAYFAESALKSWKFLEQLSDDAIPFTVR